MIPFQVNYKEHLYFAIKAIISIIFYVLLLFLLVWIVMSDTVSSGYIYAGALYLGLFIFVLFFQFGVIIGYLRGNAVKVSVSQFPDIYDIVSNQSQQLGLAAIPDVYILQSGGLLNAFAIRFLGSNYIVLYSEIVEAAYEEDKKVINFIIGHELGHIKRKHLSKRLWLFPSAIIPFLGFAYSRACEYTCDNIGYALSPEGARSGLLMVASGGKLFKKVNTMEYVNQTYMEGGFWYWMAEKLSSHPHLTKRLGRFRDILNDKPKVSRMTESSVVEKPVTDDYSRYMPK